MTQARKQGKAMVDVKADAGATGETGNSEDIHAVPDVELLQF